LWANHSNSTDNLIGGNIYGNTNILGNFYPGTTLTYDIGSGALRWRYLYVQNISADYGDFAYDLTVGDNVTANYYGDDNGMYNLTLINDSLTGEETDPYAVHRDGTVPLTGNWNAGAYNISADAFNGSNVTSLIWEYPNGTNILSGIGGDQNNSAQWNASILSASDLLYMPNMINISYGLGQYSTSGVAIGAGAYAYPNSTCGIPAMCPAGWGNNTAIGDNAIADGYWSTAIGRNSHSTGDGQGVAIGSGAFSWGVGTAIGGGANASTSTTGAVAIGDNSLATKQYSTALSPYSYSTGISSIAIGGTANASKDYSVAIGYNSSAKAEGAIAIGKDVWNDRPNTVKIGATSVYLHQDTGSIWMDGNLTVNDNCWIYPNGTIDCPTILTNGTAVSGDQNNSAQWNASVMTPNEIRFRNAVTGWTDTDGLLFYLAGGDNVEYRLYENAEQRWFVNNAQEMTLADDGLDVGENVTVGNTLKSSYIDSYAGINPVTFYNNVSLMNHSLETTGNITIDTANIYGYNSTFVGENWRYENGTNILSGIGGGYTNNTDGEFNTTNITVENLNTSNIYIENIFPYADISYIGLWDTILPGVNGTYSIGSTGSYLNNIFADYGWMTILRANEIHVNSDWFLYPNATIGNGTQTNTFDDLLKTNTTAEIINAVNNTEQLNITNVTATHIYNPVNSSFGIYNSGSCIVIGDLYYVKDC